MGKKQAMEQEKRKEIIESNNGGGSSDEQEDCYSDDSSASDSQSTAALGKKALFSRGDPSFKSTYLKKPLENLKKIAKNRQRLLILSSRGITERHRHLLNDLHVLMPHSKKGTSINFFFDSTKITAENKLDTKSKLHVLNELAELVNCNNCIFFEVRKHQDLYLWLGKTPNGPSVKFHVQNGKNQYITTPKNQQ